MRPTPTPHNGLTLAPACSCRVEPSVRDCPAWRRQRRDRPVSCRSGVRRGQLADDPPVLDDHADEPELAPVLRTRDGVEAIAHNAERGRIERVLRVGRDRNRGTQHAHFVGNLAILAPPVVHLFGPYTGVGQGVTGGGSAALAQGAKTKGGRRAFPPAPAALLPGF